MVLDQLPQGLDSSSSRHVWLEEALALKSRGDWQLYCFAVPSSSRNPWPGIAATRRRKRLELTFMSQSGFEPCPEVPCASRSEVERGNRAYCRPSEPWLPGAALGRYFSSIEALLRHLPMASATGSTRSTSTSPGAALIVARGYCLEHRLGGHPSHHLGGQCDLLLTQF